MANKYQLDRREFLKRAARLGALMAGGGALFTACRTAGTQAPKSEAPGSNGQESTTVVSKPREVPPEPLADEPQSCDDISDLDEYQLEVRKGHDYVHESSAPEERCGNCVLLKEEREPDQSCYGCKVIPGPIQRDGWCTLWVPSS